MSDPEYDPTVKMVRLDDIAELNRILKHTLGELAEAAHLRNVVKLYIALLETGHATPKMAVDTYEQLVEHSKTSFVETLIKEAARCF